MSEFTPPNSGNFINESDMSRHLSEKVTEMLLSEPNVAKYDTNVADDYRPESEVDALENDAFRANAAMDLRKVAAFSQIQWVVDMADKGVEPNVDDAPRLESGFYVSRVYTDHASDNEVQLSYSSAQLSQGICGSEASIAIIDDLLIKEYSFASQNQNDEVRVTESIRPRDNQLITEIIELDDSDTLIAEVYTALAGAHTKEEVDEMIDRISVSEQIPSSPNILESIRQQAYSARNSREMSQQFGGEVSFDTMLSLRNLLDRIS